MNNPFIKRTTASDPDFKLLIQLLDNELWDELKEDQATYDQYNKVPDIETAVIAYADEEPVACGCFKQYAIDTAEIKRMFVKKPYRGKGLSKMILHHLETWAKESGYLHAVLETSIRFTTARKLYESNGYRIIPNYPPYEGLAESVCMHKALGGSESRKLKCFVRLWLKPSFY